MRIRIESEIGLSLARAQRHSKSPATPQRATDFLHTIAAFFASMILAGCNPAEPIGGWEFKDCRHALSQLPEYSDMGGEARLKFIDQCMEKKGLRASAKCTAAGAQGKPHCEYERAPQAPSFRW